MPYLVAVLLVVSSGLYRKVVRFYFEVMAFVFKLICLFEKEVERIHLLGVRHAHEKYFPFLVPSAMRSSHCCLSGTLCFNLNLSHALKGKGEVQIAKVLDYHCCTLGLAHAHGLLTSEGPRNTMIQTWDRSMPECQYRQ